MRTGNPALNDKVFQSQTAMSRPSGDVMTLEGAVNKSVWCVLLCMAAGYWTFVTPSMVSMALPCILVAAVLAIVAMFKPAWSPLLAPAYAIFEGLALGALSLVLEVQFPGIAFQAIALTFGILFCLLMVYKSGLIKPSENFKLGVAAATMGIFFVYLVSFVLSMFGVAVPYIHQGGPIGILFSVGVIIVASLNLVLDFDFIENAAARGNTPKYMEWYGALGLLITLVWLYIEVLRLLAKLQSRD